jgi:hypothetical protein
VISRTAKQSSQGNVHRGHCARAYRRSSSVRSCFSKISFPTVDAINQGDMLEGLEGVPHPRLDRQNGRRLILLVQLSGIKGAPAVSSGAREVSGRGRGTVWRRLVCDRDHSGRPVSRPASRCRVESRSKRPPPVAGLSSIAVTRQQVEVIRSRLRSRQRADSHRPDTLNDRVDIDFNAERAVVCISQKLKVRDESR